jgi:hypothetical protein
MLKPAGESGVAMTFFMKRQYEMFDLKLGFDRATGDLATLSTSTCDGEVRKFFCALESRVFAFREEFGGGILAWGS